jgi:hypothetical protein
MTERLEGGDVAGYQLSVVVHEEDVCHTLTFRVSAAP